MTSESVNSICSAKFAEGAGVVLFPSPDSRHLFTGWSGADCAGSGANPCTVNITPAQPAIINVGAKFRQPEITITVIPGTVYGASNQVEVKALCQVLSVVQAPTQIAHVENTGATILNLPNNCKPEIWVSANPPPGPNQWGGAQRGTCHGTTGPLCIKGMADDIAVTVDYSRPLL